MVSLIKDGFPDITLYYGGGLRKVGAEGSLQDLGVVPSNHLKFPLPLFALVIVSQVTKPCMANEICQG